MPIFIGWIALSVFVGYLAAEKKRSGLGFFLLAFFLSPLIGGIALLIMGENKEAVEKARVDSGAEVKCYFCAELIKREAKICKHCGKPNHPAYHGQWLKITGFDPGSALEGKNVKAGDAIYKYNNVEIKGNTETLAAERAKAEGKTASIVFVRDAEEIELQLPGGSLGIEIVNENAPVASGTEY